MKEFKASTKRGQQIIAMGERCCWSSLNNLYRTWSSEKQRAFDQCRDQCFIENGYEFCIGCANTFCFTASWLLTKDGEEALRVETKNNSYLVWLNR